MDSSNDLRYSERRINFFASGLTLQAVAFLYKRHLCETRVGTETNRKKVNMKVIHLSTFTNCSFKKINKARR